MEPGREVAIPLIAKNAMNGAPKLVRAVSRCGLEAESSSLRNDNERMSGLGWR